MGGGCYSSRELAGPQTELGRLWRELGGLLRAILGDGKLNSENLRL